MNTPSSAHRHSGPTPETRGKLVQASGSLMPTPFRTALIVRKHPHDDTKPLIHGFRLRENAKFCDECGAPVTQVSRSAEYKQVTVLFADVVIPVRVT